MDSPCDDNGQEVWTSQMIVAPAFVDAAAKDLATIGSAISRANAEALVPITALLPAGADDVSAAIAALFATHGQAYQELSAHAVAFHEQFVQLMSAGAAQYASAEAANSSPLQIVGQTALDAINSPVQTLTGRPLIGNGANGVAGTGQNGGDGGWLYGNGGNGGSGGRAKMAATAGRLGYGVAAAMAARAGGCQRRSRSTRESGRVRRQRRRRWMDLWSRWTWWGRRKRGNATAPGVRRQASMGAPAETGFGWSRWTVVRQRRQRLGRWHGRTRH